MESLTKILEFIAQEPSGDGYGDGSGYGYGDGYGYGNGDGSKIKSFCKDTVFQLDDVPTIIDQIHGNVAKSRVLKSDLTTENCFIIKQNALFAHGKTLREARAAIAKKMFDGMSEEERITAFMEEHEPGTAYANSDLYMWHHRLTGSCDMGRRLFAEEHGIDVEHGSMTVEAFIDLTKNAYGADIIRRLEAQYQKSRKHI